MKILIARSFEDPPLIDLSKRILRLPLKALYYGWLRLHPDYPWLTYGAIRWLIRNLHPQMVGFEWGSGKSTLFIGRRIQKLYSVEHDQQWFPVVQEMVARENLQKKVELLFHPPDPHAFDPYRRRTIWWEITGYDPGKPQYAQYFDAILAFPDQFFDLILVDGRERVACLLNAEPKLKPGGFLLLDNSERKEYAIGLRPYENWERRDFSNGLTVTTIFRKPPA